MTYDRKYGKPEGLTERLENWADRLGSDKSLPWAGLGLIDDLRAAAQRISGKPEPKKAVEYDL